MFLPAESSMLSRPNPKVYTIAVRLYFSSNFSRTHARVSWLKNPIPSELFAAPIPAFDVPTLSNAFVAAVGAPSLIKTRIGILFVPACIPVWIIVSVSAIFSNSCQALYTPFCIYVPPDAVLDSVILTSGLLAPLVS